MLDRAIVAPTDGQHVNGTDLGGDEEESLAEVKDTPILSGDRRHTVSELDKYMRASKKAMGGSMFLSMSPDGCKIGHSSYILCPVANNGGGLVCWAPPQA